jgi:hypothetical protein
MLLMAVIAVLLVPIPVAAEDLPACTQVMGFSQTHNWYVDGGFESMVNGAEWQLLSWNGDITVWANPNASVYTRPRPYSSCGTPTRGVLQIAYLARRATTDQFVAQLDLALANIRAKWPTIGVIYLVPIVGCPNHAICSGNGYGASTMHLMADTVMGLRVNGVDLLAGPDLLIDTCSNFVDPRGHMNVAGSTYVAGTVASWVGGIDAASS